jgi:hypothetical protein
MYPRFCCGQPIDFRRDLVEAPEQAKKERTSAVALTRRQREIYDFIREYVASRG